MPYYWFTRRHVQRHKCLPDFILFKFLSGVLSNFLLDLETAASLQLLNVSIDLIFLSADLKLVRESVKRAMKYHSYDDFRKIDRWKCRQHYCAAALYSGGKSFQHDITEIPFLSCFHQFIYSYRSLFDGFSCKRETDLQPIETYSNRFLSYIAETRTRFLWAISSSILLNSKLKRYYLWCRLNILCLVPFFSGADSVVNITMEVFVLVSALKSTSISIWIEQIRPNASVCISHTANGKSYTQIVNKGIDIRPSTSDMSSFSFFWCIISICVGLLVK